MTRRSEAGWRGWCRHRVGLSLGAVLAAAGCSNEEVVADAPGKELPKPAHQGWTPGEVYRAPAQHPRGFMDVRGLIHAHSVYSHDACDGEPRTPEDTGPINEPCFEDFRRDLCAVQHDFVMLTDHRGSFTHTDFPEVLLYRADRGDQLVERAGAPVGNWAACADGSRALILAGAEAGTMPVGLERHVGENEGARGDAYGDLTPEGIGRLKEAGAVSLVAHTEDWTVAQLRDLPLDGFEMYNLHANMMANMGPALELVFKLNGSPEALPHPDLVLLPILEEDPRYLERWGTVLASGARRVTTMGTDCHRNTFKAKLPDNERIDSYRRMMSWFSNHLLVTPRDGGAWDDRELKDALRAGRLYGVFEVFGYAEGFDYCARSGTSTVEMGQAVKLGEGVELSVTLPIVRDVVAPQLTLRILKATEGGWEVVQTSEASTTYSVTQPGAYRAEVRVRPEHLRDILGGYAALASAEFPYIYSNAIYVTP